MLVLDSSQKEKQSQRKKINNTYIIQKVFRLAQAKNTGVCFSLNGEDFVWALI